DHVLPRSIVTRLAKGVLPQNTVIQKDAVLALTKGATVFINYLCTTANENAAKNNKKNINPKDILEAISHLELDEFRPRLEAELASELHRYDHKFYNLLRCPFHRV
ncbi:histone-fold-containing protein, partial [Kalaharituber pfeilii]